MDRPASGRIKGRSSETLIEELPFFALRVASKGVWGDGVEEQRDKVL